MSTGINYDADVLADWRATLRKLLQETRIPQKDIARQMGLDKSVVSKWKAGRLDPSVDQFARLMKLFGKSADDVLGLKPTPISSPDAVLRVVDEARNKLSDVALMLRPSPPKEEE